MSDAEKETLELDPNSGSIDENIGIVTYIMLSRIYDALCIIGDGLGKGEEILAMVEAHKMGKLLGPEPAINSEVENEA